MKFSSCRFISLFIFSIILAYNFYRPAVQQTSDLKGEVVLITGASRGIGRGIAIGFGEQKATVYITGRTLKRDDDGPSLSKTCSEVEAAGGRCIPVQCDSGSDESLEELFAQIEKEQGKLDVLVNNAFNAATILSKNTGKAFWEKGYEYWDAVQDVGLRSHYVASILGARMMSKKKKGLIVNISSLGGMGYVFDVTYGVGKAAMDRMAQDMAMELFTENIAMISLWPGLVDTETVRDRIGKGQFFAELTPRRGIAPGTTMASDIPFLNSPLSETVLFQGRTLAALARDENKMWSTGRILQTSQLGWVYNVVDERGVRSPSFLSLKSVSSVLISPILKLFNMYEVTGQGEEETTFLQNLYWNILPDGDFPIPLIQLVFPNVRLDL